MYLVLAGVLSPGEVPYRVSDPCWNFYSYLLLVWCSSCVRISAARSFTLLGGSRLLCFSSFAVCSAKDGFAVSPFTAGISNLENLSTSSKLVLCWVISYCSSSRSLLAVLLSFLDNSSIFRFRNVKRLQTPIASFKVMVQTSALKSTYLTAPLFLHFDIVFERILNPMSRVVIKVVRPGDARFREEGWFAQGASGASRGFCVFLYLFVRCFSRPRSVS